MVIFIHRQLFVFVGGCFYLQAVVFIYGWSFGFVNSQFHGNCHWQHCCVVVVVMSMVGGGGKKRVPVFGKYDCQTNIVCYLSQINK